MHGEASISSWKTQLPPAAQALVELGRQLRDNGYDFVTVTPATHQRVLQRRQIDGHAVARDVRDVFGFSCAFSPELLPGSWLRLLNKANAVEQVTADATLLRARVRFSTLRGGLYVHSAFPTLDPDSVFFGPDSYRYVALLERWLPRVKRLIDVGCGSGVGGISMAQRASQRVLADINGRSLEFARVNAALNAVDAEFVRSDLLEHASGPLDAVIMNPPYMRDALGRDYRDGGGSHGEALSARIVRQALHRLRPGGVLIVYTGTAIVRGRDTFLQAISQDLDAPDVRFEYEELDPDVFGEELSEPLYQDVERIAAVGLRVELRS